MPSADFSPSVRKSVTGLCSFAVASAVFATVTKGGSFALMLSISSRTCICKEEIGGMGEGALRDPHVWNCLFRHVA